MGPLATKLLLESLLAPFLLAGFLLLSARALRWDRAGLWVPALAVTLALSTTFIFAFGWPSGLILSARMKIMLSAIIAFAIGVVVERHGWFSRPILIAGAIGLTVWVGFPVLQQDRPALALAILPMTMVLAATLLISKSGSAGRMSLLLMSLAAVLGIAAIAAFARSFSFAQLSAALASAILAIVVVERKPPSSTTLATIAAILLTLLTSLLLYTEASLTALIVLSTVIGAERLARIGWADPSRRDSHPPPLRILLCSLVPLAAAVLIARIDAGPISIY